MDEKAVAHKQHDDDTEPGDNSLCKPPVSPNIDVDIQTEDTRALDGGWGWMIVAACFLGHVILVSVSRSIGVMFVHWMDKYNTNAATTAWVLSLFNVMRMLAGPFVCILCERWGCRRVVFIGGILYATGCMLGAFATDIIYLYLTFGIIGGLGGGCMLAPMFVMLNEYFHKKKGLAMSLATMGSGIGVLVIAPILTYMKDEFGDFGAMLFLSGLALNTFVVAALFRPLNSKLNRTSGQFRMDSSKADPNSSSNHNGIDNKKFNLLSTKERYINSERDSLRSEMIPDCDGIIVSTREIARNTGVDLPVSRSKCEKFKSNFLILKNITFWTYSFYMAAMPCGVQIYNLYTPGLMQEHKYSDQQSALVLSIAGASDTVGRFIAGFIFDLKLVRGRRWPIHCLYGIGVGVVVLSNGFQKDLAGFIIIAILWGLFESGYHGQRATILPEFIDKDQVSRSLGIMLFWQGIGSLMSPIFSGFLRDELGTFSVCFYYAGTAMTFCASLFLVNYCIVRRRKKSHIKCPE